MKRLISIGECMLELSPEGDLWRMNVAGDTFNTAWYARRLLPADWEVGYVTRLGTDAFSDRVAAFITQSGVRLHDARHPSRGVGLYAIQLKDGERSFSYWRDTSAARTLADEVEPLASALPGAAAIHVSGITLAILPPAGRERLIDALRGSGVGVLDPNLRLRLWESPDVARQVLTRAAGAVACVLPSFEDEAALFGDRSPEDTLARYQAAGAVEVVVKNGGGAILAAAPEGRLNLTLPRVTPLDTTGAGDSFNAGYLAARLQGMGLEAAIRRAHAVASRVVMHPGALIPVEALRDGD
jgi:2-dehydro-3-deoxygluconokinase